MTVVAIDLREQVTAIVAARLHVSPADLDPHRPFALYGLDSVSAMELIAALEDATGRAWPDWMLAEHPTLHDLLEAIDGGDTAAAAEDVADLIAGDARLPLDIILPSGAPAVVPPKTVLLTGVTGLLGAHLLRALIDDTRAHVLCLVRAGAGEGLARVRANLERHGLWTDDVASRIEVVRGDLARPGLGLEPAAFDSCADAVDAIFHAAADVDWVQPYAALRQVNVSATLDVIRLATTTRMKTVHFVSSISTCYAPDARSCSDEDTHALPFAPSLPLGYAQTKAVSEALLREAATRGLPVRVIRPSLLAGDARTGVAPTDDLIARLIKGCLQMGVAPDLDWEFDAVPVDAAARAMVRLSSTPAGDITLHIVTTEPRSWPECVLWMRLRGYAIRLMPYADWTARLEAEASAPSHPLAGLHAFFQRGRMGAEGSAAERLQQHRHAHVSSERSQRRLETDGLAPEPISGELLGRYFDGWIERGFLHEPTVPRVAPVHRRSAIHRAPAVHHDQSSWLDPAVFNAMAWQPADSPPVVRVERLARGSRHSIISELTSWRGRSETGLFDVRLHRDGAAPLEAMLKAKPRDDDALDVAVALAEICDPRLGEVVAAFRDDLAVRGSHEREIAIYADAPVSLRSVVPVCYATLRNNDESRWAALIERLDDVELMNSASTPAAWTPRYLDAALRGLAVVQSTKTSGVFPGLAAREKHPTFFAPLYAALAVHAAPRVAAWAGAEAAARLTRLAATPEAWRPALDDAPQVLVHNDFNPRNLAFRRGDRGAPRLVAYDWELATLGAPQQDLAELLCFTKTPDVFEEDVTPWIERGRELFLAHHDVRIDAAAWRRGLNAALAQLLVDRFAFYTLIDRVRRQPFLPRVIATCARLLDLTEPGIVTVRRYACTSCTRGPGTCFRHLLGGWWRTKEIS